MSVKAILPGGKEQTLFSGASASGSSLDLPQGNDWYQLPREPGEVRIVSAQNAGTTEHLMHAVDASPDADVRQWNLKGGEAGRSSALSSSQYARRLEDESTWADRNSCDMPEPIPTRKSPSKAVVRRSRRRVATRRQLRGALAHAVTKRLGKSRIIEDADLPRRQKGRHAVRVARPGQGAGDDDPVIAGEHSGEALAVTLCQQPPQPSLPRDTSDASILPCLVPAWPG